MLLLESKERKKIGLLGAKLTPVTHRDDTQAGRGTESTPVSKGNLAAFFWPPFQTLAGTGASVPELSHMKGL